MEERWKDIENSIIVNSIKMDMILKRMLPVMLAAAMMLQGMEVRAEVRPAWVDRSEEALNAKRINDTYEFKVLRSEDPELNRLHEGRFYPLFKYLADTYGSMAESMALDSLAVGSDMPTYRVTFDTPQGRSSVIARLVDVYESIDYNVEQDPVFELCQLFAVGRKDTDVVFDDFARREISRPLAGLISVVPGAGQLYKGNKAKGYALLGTTVFFAGAAAASQYKMVEWREMIDKDPGFRDSWESKSIAMRKQRNILLGAIGCLSAYSIFDALVGEEVPRITVKKSDGTKISVAPQAAGLALRIDF